MEKQDKPKSKCGLVIKCDSTTLEIYHEFKIYRTARTQLVAQTNRADWVAFKLDESGEVVNMRPLPRRWSSIVDNDGDIRLNVNAVIRDETDYPILNYPDNRQPMPNKPWSFELDWLEDPRGLMHWRRGVREGWMHEVTVKFVQEDEDRFSFPILEVHYESPDDMQLNFFYAPWVEELMMTMTTVSDGAQPVREREVGKVHLRNRYHGIIMRGYPTDNRYFVWSKESGMLYINMNRDNFATMHVGNFVHFRVVARTAQCDMVATTLTLSQNTLKETKIMESANQLEAAVKTQFRVPPADKCSNQIEQVDLFLGLIRVSQLVLSRKLAEIERTLDDVYGRNIWIWVSARNLLADDQRGMEPRFWSFESVDEDLYVDDV